MTMDVFIARRGAWRYLGKVKMRRVSPPFIRGPAQVIVFPVGWVRLGWR